MTNVIYGLMLSGLLILSSCVSTSSQKSQSSAAKGQELTNAESIFWQVEKDGRRHYLFGTLHLGVNLADLPPMVLKKLESADTFVGELKSFEMDPYVMSQFLYLPEHESLSDLIGDQYVQRFIQILESNSYPFDHSIVERLSLYSVYSTLLSISAEQEQSEAADEAEALSFSLKSKQKNDYGPSAELIEMLDSAPAPIDLKLLAYARQKGLDILGFEAIEEQLIVFQKFCTSDRVTNMIDHIDEAESLISDLSRAYQESGSQSGSDVDPFTALMTSMMSAMEPEEINLIFFDRNEIWMQRFEGIVKGKNSFIAVGAGHIPGNKGLVELFKQRGYRVKPLYFRDMRTAQK